MADDQPHQRRSSDDVRTRALQALSSLIDVSEDVFLLADHDGNVLYNNGQRSRAEQLARHVRQQMPLAILTTPGSHWRGEVAIDCDDATFTYDIQVSCEDGTLAIHARDISPSVRLQSQLAHLASHDALTDLPNRAHLLRRLTDAVERSREERTYVTVLYVDIDDLKHVNDAIGHDVGDEVIAAVAGRLVAAIRPDDVVARIGGDEFVVLTTGIESDEAASTFAERVRASASGRLDRRGAAVDTSVSVGVVMYRGLDTIQPPAETADAMLRDADTAMYHAKTRGKSRCEVFTEDMRTADRERSQLRNDLTQVIALEQLRLDYQPIASPHSGVVAAAEALVRWHHPHLGVLPPASFLSLADDSDTSAAIGDWVLRRALADLRMWIDDGRVDGRFAVHVNVARLHVERAGFADSVFAALGEFGLRAAQLVLEFDESVVRNESGTAVRVLDHVRRRGVRLSLDDFGTGTSSLTGLRQWPVDHVKLDGTLVRDLGSGDGGEPVVRGIIQLAHGIGVSVIAESVTSPIQVERLKALGCDYVQGFHIGEPLPASEFTPATATVL